MKLFGGLNITWLKTILFALVAGIITGLVASIPAIENTSLHDIAVSYEWWLIFAFVIASNSEKSWESALKTFLFFLISQPFCFLTEVALGHLTMDMALYYYGSIWGPATILTLPGGFIAYYIQKQNILGCIILGLGNTIQILMGVAYIVPLVQNPPFHLITILVCFASVIVMTLSIQKSRKNQIITFLIAILVSAGLIALVLANGRTIFFGA